MRGGGKVTIPANGQFNISGGSSKFLRDRPIDNLGTTTWTGGGQIRSGDGAVFNNLAGAIFDAQNNGTFTDNLGGGAQFNNLTGATFRKSVGTATTTMNVSVQNDGTVDVVTGTLRITRAGASTGTFDVAAGAALQFATNYTANNGTAIIGAGSTQLTSGTFTLGTTGSDVMTAFNLQLVAG